MEDRPNDAPKPNGGDGARSWMTMAIVFEAALVPLALGIGALVGCWPLDTLSWNPADLGRGLLATVPLVIALVVGMRLPVAPIKRLKMLLQRAVLPLFRGASWPTLALISLAAGIGEELLFRGLIQHALTQAIDHRAAPWIAIGITSLLFGLAHAMSRTYAVLAAAISVYLGWLLIETDNLLVPIVAHACYDFVAFVYFLREDSLVRSS